MVVVAFSSQGFWENVQQFIPRLGFFVFLKVEISLFMLIPLFRPGSVHSGSVSWDDCDRVFADELYVSSFPERFTPCLDSNIARFDFVGSKVYMCLSETCHLHFWQNDQGLLHATAVMRVWNGHRMRVSTQSTLEKNTLLPLLPGFEFATFQSQVQPSKQQTIPAPHRHS